MRFKDSLFASVLAAVAIFAALDFAIDRTLPHFSRLRENFSAQYVRRELATLRGTHPIVVLGDSVLWGYGVDADRCAISLLRQRRPGVVNLAYPGGSPINSLTMFRVLREAGIVPRAILLDVNQKTFNPLDNAYARVHPSVDEIATERGLADSRFAYSSGLAPSADARIDRALGARWHFYGMRSDIRDALFGAADFSAMLESRVERFTGAAAERAAAHTPQASDFEGTYDLTPLDGNNESFRALRALARAAAASHVPVVALMTPTNHRLLHEYIDNPDYAHNVALTAAMLRDAGVRVVDLDTAFPAGAFIDNDHLTGRANARLARIVERALRPV